MRACQAVSPRLIILWSLLWLVSPAMGQAPDRQLRLHTSVATGRVSFVTAADGGPITVQVPAGKQQAEPFDFLTQHGQLFGVTDPTRQLALQKVQVDPLGHTHTTYEQVYDGIEVFSGVLKVHQDAAGQFIAANGDFYPIKPTLDTKPTLDADSARQAALAAVDRGIPTVQLSKLVIVDPGWYGDPTIGARLAYHIVLRDVTVALEEAFFVDAHSGEIIDQWSLLHTAKDRAIYNGNGGSGLPGTLARGEGDSPVGSPEDVNRAYDYYGDTYDYFFRAFGRDSVDGLGLTLVATVNSTAPPCPNAFWSGSLLQMVFCTGTVTDDIVAHELTHGVTQFTANLIYQNQSGQLNESYSDVFGEMVDLFNGDAAFAGTPGGTPWPTHPTGPGLDTPNNLRTACTFSPSHTDGVRWLLGEDATAFGGAIRDMWDPPCMGDPDQADSPLQTCNANDSGGVHSGSGIPNHAFTMLVDGKTFNGHTVVGIGPIKAGAVWYRALSVYLTPASDFEDAYPAFNQAAADLIGTTPNDPRTGLPSASMFTASDATQVDEALLAVEMNTRGACGAGINVLISAAAVECTLRNTIFADDFEAGTNGWTVSNSNPPTPYDWVQVSGSLPLSRSGTAWFGEDRSVGDCGANNEAGLHSLFSPVIDLPSPLDFPVLAFSHFMSTEIDWDGGNLKIRVNGGAWQLVPRTAFLYTPYNFRINSSLNPLSLQEGWTGSGGGWGRAVVDLGSLVSAGDTVQFRFDFGKDGCTGVLGWYVDDFELYDCQDCNSNGIPDHREFAQSMSSAPLGNIGTGSPQTFTLISPPDAKGPVTISFYSLGDFSSDTEWVDVDINGTSVVRLFEIGGNDCASTPNFGEITLAAVDFNVAVGGGNASINMLATADVNPSLASCGGLSFISVFVEYATFANDANTNGILDECEVGGCTTNGDCADTDVCTTDTCVGNTCVFTPIPTCCNTNGECVDTNGCTTDACVGNVCVNTPIPDCCTSGTECDDNENCTADTCVNNVCDNMPIPDCCNTDGDCDDSDVCTTDTCVNDACVFTPIPTCCNTDGDCTDTDVCTTDTCVANTCVFAPIPTCCNTDGDCDDSDVCTTDTCVNDACVFTPIPTCCNTDGDCDDGNDCTTETCVANACVPAAIPDCCNTDGDCDDSDVCTTDTCVNNACANMPIPTQAITEIINLTGDGADNVLASPFHIAVEDGGTAYVTGFNSHNAFKITPAGVITEIIDAVGDGAGHVLSRPFGIAVDGVGNVYVAGFISHNAFKITPAGVITEIIDVTGDGAGNAIDSPRGIAVDATGNVYVAGSNSHNAFKITPAGVVTQIIDATGDGAGHGLTQPSSIAVDAAGNIYVAGRASDNAFKITPAGVIMQIIDPTGDGAGNGLSGPDRIAVDVAGNAYLTGTFSGNAFKITPAGVVTQIIDVAGDGAGHILSQPFGIAVDGVSNVYVAGFNSHNAFKITPLGVVTEIIDATGDSAGNGLNQPEGIAVDAAGNVYLTGVNSHNVFRITPIPTCCNTDGDCDDSDVCTTDTCVNNDCANTPIPTCCNTDGDCNDGDACTTETCVANACVPAPIPDCCNTDGDCDDGDACTTETCVNNTCVPAPIPGCCNTDGDCDDGDVCTTETCVTNACVPAPIPGCCNTDGDCDDSNVCTTDTCVNNACDNMPIPDCCNTDGDCIDTDVCTTDTCVNNACVFTPIPTCCNTNGDCTDTDVCTTDTCVNNACVFTPIPTCCNTDGDCTDTDVCTTDTCVNNACVFTPIPTCCNTNGDCDDSLFCNGVETCVGNACQDGADPCQTTEWCEEAGSACVLYGNGDSDADGDIDLQDAAHQANCFGQQGLGACQVSNLTGTGTVELDDWSDLETLLQAGGPQ